MGDENYPPIRIPGIPGMEVEKDSSDSDPEAVAARKERKKVRLDRAQADELREEKAKEEEQRRQEAILDLDQLFHVFCDEDERTKVLEDMSSIDCSRPDGFEERVQVASTLRDKAKVIFEGSETEKAIRYWMGAVHCLDFTPRQLREQPTKEKQRVFEALALVLSNISLARRKLGNTTGAIYMATIGLEVVCKVKYEASKDMRVKLRIRRALARGDERDFEGARSDAKHVLDLIPDHDEGNRIVKNCQAALRREGGPQEHRWKGSLNKELPQKVQKPANSLGEWNKRVFMLAPILVLLAFFFARYM